MRTASLVLALGVVLGALAFGLELQGEDPKPTSPAVYYVSVGGGTGASLGHVMTRLLVYEPSRSRRFKVVGEYMIAEVLKHRGFSQSDGAALKLRVM